MSEVIHALDPIPTVQPSSIMAVISRAAMDPNVDIDKMERLMAMHERLLAADASKAYTVAMTAAQKAMGPISADAHNKQTHSDYATYAKLDKVLRPIYTGNGFALSYNTEATDKTDVVRVTCKVSHSAGHSELFAIDMPADGKGAKGGDVMTKTHATGAASAYGMRYLLKMIFNVAVGEDDTDGNAPPKARAETITVEHAAEIKGLIEQTNTDVKRFLLAFGSAPSVDHMLEISYEQAKTLLLKKLEKMHG